MTEIDYTQLTPEEIQGIAQLILSWQAPKREYSYDPLRRKRPEALRMERDRRRLAKYGITREDYESLIACSGGVCNICQIVPPDGKFHIDHNHLTGKVRGILCMRCNCALERIDSIIGWTRLAEKYLKDSQ